MPPPKPLLQIPPPRTTTSTTTTPPLDRILESALWTTTLTLLHLTFDILVQHQYAREIDPPAVLARALRAWALFLFLFYCLHGFDEDDQPDHDQHDHDGAAATPVRRRRRSRSRPLRQAVFFVGSVGAGCSLVHVTNSGGYLATMKQAPPLGCLWLWAVVELDLVWACGSLLVVGGFLRVAGYQLT
ncbi:hypothetical protein E4U41_006242 [Claviceps citrina]|nr:hypothetical protein E4U41_006242 [Claviceps citrina]